MLWQNGIKSCITFTARSAHIFERCVGIGVGSVDQNLFNDFNALGCSLHASNRLTKSAGLK